MISSTASPLLKNITRYDLDNRIGKLLLRFHGLNHYGERRFFRPGHLAEITDTRPYTPGDPVKDIDWKIWGKLEELHIKLREGTAKSNISLVLDDSKSMQVSYDQENPSKWIAALTLAYALGKFTIKSRDKLRLETQNELFNIFSDARLYEIILSLEEYSHDQSASDFSGSKTAKALPQKPNYWVWISDFFMDSKIIEQWIKDHLGVHEHIIFIHLFDTYESKFIFQGEKDIRDPEAGPGNQDLFVDTGLIREKYLKEYEQHFSALRHLCHSYSIPWIPCHVQDDPIDIIHRYLV